MKNLDPGIGNPKGANLTIFMGPQSAPQHDGQVTDLHQSVLALQDS